MARYQIMYWKEIPAQVKATDDRGGKAKAMLPDRFSTAIDTAAMVEGSTATDDYLDGWAWGPAEERAGSAEDLVRVLVQELDEAYPPSRLAKLIREFKGSA